jgi:TetR/AcrR family transcriptional repressor of uid operon
MNPSRLGRPVDADRRAARRRQIINGARGVFARKGFHAASTAEISAEAGVSGANLYQYFATKDDLIMSLIEENLAGDLARIESLNDAKSLKQGIMSLGKALFETAPDRQSHALRLEILAESFLRILARTATNSCSKPPPILMRARVLLQGDDFRRLNGHKG